jgi:hypothetical protein
MRDLLEKHFHRLQRELGVETVDDLGVLQRRDLLRFAVAAAALRPGQEPPADVPVQAHPLFLSSVVSWTAGPQEIELDPDGLHPSTRHGLPAGIRLMGAGQDVTFHTHAHEGTPVRVHTALTDVRLTSGRSGDLLVGTVTRRFVDVADSRPLVTSHEKWIAR